MQRSERIGDLAEALAQAQGEMSPAVKDSSNPFYRSKYADLAACWEACRAPLAAHGLAVVQAAHVADGRVEVETMLAHASGEWISDTLSMPVVREKKGEGYAPADDPQAVGTAITYARRYSLAALVGLSQEDDDGNAASGVGKKNGHGATKPAETHSPVKLWADMTKIEQAALKRQVQDYVAVNAADPLKLRTAYDRLRDRQLPSKELLATLGLIGQFIKTDDPAYEPLLTYLSSEQQRLNPAEEVTA